MGIRYLTPDEIKDEHEHIKSRVNEKPNWFARSGDAVDTIVNYVNNKDAKIIDIGIGQGYMAVDLLNKGYTNISGVDIDDYLDEELKDKINVNVCDICFDSLPYEDDSVDVVSMVAIVEHLENPLFPLRECARVLKSEGYLFIAVPHIFTLRSRISFLLSGELKGFNRHNNHITLHTKAMFDKLFLRDFDLAETRYSTAYFKILGKKFILPKVLAPKFSDKIMYVLKRKES